MSKLHPSILPLSLVEIVNMLGISLLIPILPNISEQFGGGYLMYGILLSIYSFFQFFAAPLWWSLSDIYGRKRILLISQRGTLMSRVIFGAAWFVPMDYSFLHISMPLWVILAARVFDWITAWNTAVISAYIADISHTKAQKVKYFGIIAAMTWVGIMLWPLLGGLSANFSSRWNFGTIIGAAFLSLLTFTILRVSLPESPYKPLKKQLISLKQFIHKINIPNDIITISKSDRRMGILRLLIGVFFALFLWYTTIYVLHATNELGLSIVQIGLVWTMVWLVFAANQIAVVPYVSRLFGPYHMLLWWHIMMAIWLGGMTYVETVWPFLLYSIVLASGIARCMTLFNIIITSYTKEQNEGYILWLKESIHAAASIIAPLVGAGLYALFSQEIFIIYASVTALMVVIIYTQLDQDQYLDK